MISLVWAALAFLLLAAPASSAPVIKVDSIALPRLTFSQGQTFSATVTVSNTNGASTTEVTDYKLIFDALTFTQATKTTLPFTLNAAGSAGDSKDFKVEVTVPSDETGTVNVTAEASEASGKDTLFTPTTIIVQKPAAISIQSITITTSIESTTATSAVIQGQQNVAVKLNVLNTGGATARIVRGNVTFNNTTTSQDVSEEYTTGTTAVGLLIPGGQSRIVTFTVNVSGQATVGDVSIDASLVATDINTGIEVSDTGADQPGKWRVERILTIRGIVLKSDGVTGVNNVSVIMRRRPANEVGKAKNPFETVGTDLTETVDGIAGTFLISGRFSVGDQLHMIGARDMVTYSTAEVSPGTKFPFIGIRLVPVENQAGYAADTNDVEQDFTSGLTLAQVSNQDGEITGINVFDPQPIGEFKILIGGSEVPDSSRITEGTYTIQLTLSDGLDVGTLTIPGLPASSGFPDPTIASVGRDPLRTAPSIRIDRNGTKPPNNGTFTMQNAGNVITALPATLFPDPTPGNVWKYVYTVKQEVSPTVIDGNIDLSLPFTVDGGNNTTLQSLTPTEIGVLTTGAIPLMSLSTGSFGFVQPGPLEIITTFVDFRKAEEDIHKFIDASVEPHIDITTSVVVAGSGAPASVSDVMSRQSTTTFRYAEFDSTGTTRSVTYSVKITGAYNTIPTEDVLTRITDYPNRLPGQAYDNRQFFFQEIIVPDEQSIFSTQVVSTEDFRIIIDPDPPEPVLGYTQTGLTTTSLEIGGVTTTVPIIQSSSFTISVTFPDEIGHIVPRSTSPKNPQIRWDRPPSGLSNGDLSPTELTVGTTSTSWSFTTSPFSESTSNGIFDGLTTVTIQNAFDAAGWPNDPATTGTRFFLFDTAPPIGVTNLVASPVQASKYVTGSFKLTWNLTQDNGIGVKEYRVVRDGTDLTNNVVSHADGLTTTSFTVGTIDLNELDDGQFVWSVFPKDKLNKENTTSNESLTLLLDRTPPTALTATPTSTKVSSQFQLTWPTATDAAPGFVKSLTLVRSFPRTGATTRITLTTASTSFTQEIGSIGTQITTQGRYEYRLEPADLAGLTQTGSPTAVVVYDTTPPDPISGLTITGTATSPAIVPFSLQWTHPVTDLPTTGPSDEGVHNAGFLAFRIVRDGKVIGTSTTTSFTENGPLNTGTHVYEVEVLDQAGNAAATASAATTLSVSNIQPATLAITGISTGGVTEVLRGQSGITVTVGVENGGEATATVNAISLSFKQGEDSTDNEYTTVLSSPTLNATLPGGGTVNFNFTVTVDSQATLGNTAIAATVSGFEDDSNRALSDTSGDEGASWEVKDASQFTVKGFLKDSLGNGLNGYTLTLFKYISDSGPAIEVSTDVTRTSLGQKGFFSIVATAQAGDTFELEGAKIVSTFSKTTTFSSIRIIPQERRNDWLATPTSSLVDRTNALTQTEIDTGEKEIEFFDPAPYVDLTYSAVNTDFVRDGSLTITATFVDRRPISGSTGFEPLTTAPTIKITRPGTQPASNGSFTMSAVTTANGSNSAGSIWTYTFNLQQEEDPKVIDGNVAVKVTSGLDASKQSTITAQIGTSFTALTTGAIPNLTYQSSEATPRGQFGFVPPSFVDIEAQFVDLRLNPEAIHTFLGEGQPLITIRDITNPSSPSTLLSTGMSRQGTSVFSVSGLDTTAFSTARTLEVTITDAFNNAPTDDEITTNYNNRQVYYSSQQTTGFTSQTTLRSGAAIFTVDPDPPVPVLGYSQTGLTTTSVSIGGTTTVVPVISLLQSTSYTISVTFPGEIGHIVPRNTDPVFPTIALDRPGTGGDVPATQLTPGTTSTSWTFTTIPATSDDSLILDGLTTATISNAFDSAGHANDPVTSSKHFIIDTTSPIPVTGINKEPAAPTSFTSGDFRLVWNPAVDGGVGTLDYLILEDGQQIATVLDVTTSGKLGTDILLGILGDGSHRWTVQPRDKLGQTREPGTNLDLVVDRQAPAEMPITGVTPGTIVGGAFTLQWDPASDEPAEGIVKALTLVRTGPDGTKRIKLATSQTVFNQAVSSGQNAITTDGQYVYRLEPLDQAGNAQTNSPTTLVTFDTSIPDAVSNLAAPTSTNGDFLVTWDPVTTDVSGISTYVVLRDGTEVAAIDGSETSYLEDSGLPQGTYVFEIQPIDNAGNRRTSSNPTTSVIVDLTAPGAVPSITVSPSTPTSGALSLSWGAATDTGGSGLSTYLVFQDTTNIGAVSAPATTFATSPADGTFVYTVQTVDAAGNVNSSTTTQATGIVDSSPPSAVTVFSITPSPFTSQADYVLSWGAVSDVGDAGLAGYQILEDSSVLSTVGTALTTFARPSPLPPEGAHEYEVRPFDKAGNVQATGNTTAALTVDVTPPTTITVLSGVDSGSTSQTFTLTWPAATDNLSGVPSYLVRRGTTTSNMSVIATTGTTFFVQSPLPAPDGIYLYDVQARDGAGNIQTTSNTTRTILIDTTAPSPITDLSGGPSTPTSQTFTLTWSASTDALTTVVAYVVEQDGANLGQTTTDITTFLVSPLPADGTHTYQVLPLDRLGNLQSSSNTVTVTVDTNAPPAVSTLTASPTDFTSTTLSFSWSGVTDAGSGLAGYRFLEDGTLITVLGPSQTSFTQTTKSSDGSRTFEVQPFDQAGNIQTAGNGTDTVVVDSVDPDAVTPLSGVSSNLTSQPFTLTWTLPSDDRSGLDSQQVLRDGQAVANLGSTATSYDESTLPSDGAHTYEVRALDNAGNHRTTGNDIRTITVDTVRPTVALSYSAPSTTTVGQGPLSITATFSETIASRVFLALSGGGVSSLNDLGPTEMTTSGASRQVFVLTPTIVPGDDGLFMVRLSGALDAAGNSSLDPTNATIIVETAGPTASLTYSKPATSVNPGLLGITATFDEPVQATPTIGIDRPGSGNDVLSSSQMSGTTDPTIWTFEYDVLPQNGTTIIDGEASVSLSAFDLAGNALESTTNSTFVIDTLGPAGTLDYGRPLPVFVRAETLRITATFDAPLASQPLINIDRGPSGGLGTGNDIAAQAMQPTAISSVWTFDYTVATDDGTTILDGPAVVTISNAKDAAGNEAPALQPNTFTVDTRSPTVTLSFSKAPTAVSSGPLRITATFSETMAGATLSLAGGAASTANDFDPTAMVDSGDGKTFTLSPQILPGDDGDFALALTAADLAGNAVVQPSDLSLTIDTVAPTPSVAYSKSSSSVGPGTLRITVTFDEPLATTPLISIDRPGTGNDIGTATLTGGPSVWTHDYVVSAANGTTILDGLVSITLSNALDAAGNPAGDPSNATFTVDTTPPGVALTFSSGQANALPAGDLRITATFTEPVVTIPTLALFGPAGPNNLASTAMVATTDARVWILDRFIVAGNDGLFQIRIANAFDAAGNVSENAVPGEVQLKTLGPDVTLAYSKDAAGLSTGVLDITATFSRPLVTVPRISINGPTAGANDVASATMSGTATASQFVFSTNIVEGHDGTFRVTLENARDAAGNDAMVPKNGTFVVDTDAPGLTLSYSRGPRDVPAGTLTLTATFDEPVTAAPTLEVTGPAGVTVRAPASMTATTTDTVYVADIPISEGNDGTFRALVTGARDVAGNEASLTTTGNDVFVVDTVAPAVVLTYSQRSDAVPDGPLTLTATFSEVLVTAPSITLTGPTPGGANSQPATPMTSSGDGLRFTFTQTIVTGDDGDFTATVSGGRDRAGNANLPAANNTYTVAAEPVSVTFTYSKNPLGIASGTVEITATFGRPLASTPTLAVQGPAGVNNRTAAAMTPTATATIFTTALDIATGNDGEFRLVLDNVRDLNGNTQATLSGEAFVIDTVAPSAQLTYSQNAASVNQGTLTVTARFTQALATAPLLAIAGPPGANNRPPTRMSATADPSQFLLTVPIVSGNDGAFQVTLSDARDVAGNVVSQVTGTSFVIDTVRPSATVTFDRPSRIYLAGPLRVTATFDDVIVSLPSLSLSGPDGLNNRVGEAMNATTNSRVFTFQTTLVAGNDGDFNLSITGARNPGGLENGLVNESFQIDTTPPVLLVESPGNGELITGNLLVAGSTTDATTVTVSFQTGGGEIPLTTLTVPPGTARLFERTATPATSGSLSSTPPVLTIRAVDAAGNEATAATRSVRFDSDGDGLPDDVEVAVTTAQGLPPSATAADPTLDSDADGLSNIEEFLLGTSPDLRDTDDDGVDDNVEREAGQDPLSPADNRPTAVATTPSRTVDPQVIVLDATGSTDPGGATLGFLWDQLAGPSVGNDPRFLNSRGQAQAFFLGAMAGDYSFRVRLSKGSGFRSPPSATVDVTVRDLPPVARTGPDRVLELGQSPLTVLLDGTQSFDPNQDDITYTWAVTSGPAGGASVTPRTGSATPQLRVNLPGVYEVELTVSSMSPATGQTLTSKKTVFVTANSRLQSVPMARAGIDQVLLSTQTNVDVSTILYGRDSVDPDRFTTNPLRPTLDFTWSQVSGPTIPASDFTADPRGQQDGNALKSVNLGVRFRAPGKYVFRLQVRKKSGGGTLGLTSAPDEVEVRVVRVAGGTNTPPRANAGMNRIVENFTTSSPIEIKLNGLASSDAEDSLANLRFAWKQRRSGEDDPTPEATLSDPASAEPSFAPDAPGLYVFELVVTDSQGAESLPARVTVEVRSPANSGAPEVTRIEALRADGSVIDFSNPFQLTTEGDDLIRLNAVASDPDGSPLSFQWRQLFDGATAATVLMRNSRSNLAEFRPRTPGAFLFEVLISDGELVTTRKLLVPVDSLKADGNSGITPVVAGPSQPVPLNPDGSTTVLLDASASFDRDRNIAGRTPGDLIYLWKQTGGPIQLVFDRTASVLSLDVPAGFFGTFTFEVFIDEGQDAITQQVSFQTQQAAGGGGGGGVFTPSGGGATGTGGAPTTGLGGPVDLASGGGGGGGCRLWTGAPVGVASEGLQLLLLLSPLGLLLRRRRGRRGV